MRRRPYVNPFVKALSDFRNHVRRCNKCHPVLRGGGDIAMCTAGSALLATMIGKSEELVKLHRKAYDLPGGAVYACPDIHKHGAAYAATVEAQLPGAIQPELF